MQQQKQAQCNEAAVKSHNRKVIVSVLVSDNEGHKDRERRQWALCEGAHEQAENEAGIVIYSNTLAKVKVAQTGNGGDEHFAKGPMSKQKMRQEL